MADPVEVAGSTRSAVYRKGDMMPETSEESRFCSTCGYLFAIHNDDGSCPIEDDEREEDDLVVCPQCGDKVSPRDMEDGICYICHAHNEGCFQV